MSINNQLPDDCLPPIITNLIYDDNRDISSVINVLLIDSSIGSNQLFFDSANANTFPIIYSYTSDTQDLIQLLQRKFTNIQRISFVFHDPINKFKAFMNNKSFFINEDVEPGQTTFSDNVVFLQNLITQFSISNFDFLACNSLNYYNWKAFYELLNLTTNVICGASNNNTGNINYGGDWLMENTNIDIRNIYFNESILNFSTNLEITTISQSGETIYFKYNTDTSTIQYSQINQTSWINASFPIQIINSSPSSSNVLTVKFNTDLEFYTSTDNYFISGSSYITFDGQSNICNCIDITDYGGLIENGNSVVSGYSNITVQNISCNSINSTLAEYCGWIGRPFFAKGDFYDGVKNSIVNNCNSNGYISNASGGILGWNAGAYTGSVTVTNCFSTGDIGPAGGGIFGLYAGQQLGSATAINCYSTGTIGYYAGGIFASAAYWGSAIATNSYSTGDISGSQSGGIFAPNSGLSENGLITATNCFSWGDISGGNSGGIFGPDCGTAIATNCYSSGAISGGNSGGISGPGIASVTETNCYVANGNWSDSIANSILSIQANWISGTDNTPYLLASFSLYPICFVAGTNILTDQGIVAIEQINPLINTINQNKIIAVTKTLTNEPELVCIEPNALGDNKPSEKTILSYCHGVLYNNKMVQAKYLKNRVKNKKSIYNIKYNGEILYNILMENHDIMNANNMIVETLDPKHIIAKLYSGKYNEIQKRHLLIEINECVKKNDFKKLNEISCKI